MVERFDAEYDYDFEGERPGIELHFTGIADAEHLARADLDTLIKEHLRSQEAGSKLWYRDGAVLSKMFITGIYTERKRPGTETPYPRSRDGFMDFLHDSGSHISPDEGGRRMKVFETINVYPVSIIRQIEHIGPNKAFACVKYVKPENVDKVLELALKTQYSGLRKALALHFPLGTSGRPARDRVKAMRERHRMAVELLLLSDSHMIAGMFIPRKIKQEAWQEWWLQDVYRFAMGEIGERDIDAFVMRVGELIVEHFIPEKAAELESRKADYRRGEERCEDRETAELERMAEAGD